MALCYYCPRHLSPLGVTITPELRFQDAASRSRAPCASFLCRPLQSWWSRGDRRGRQDRPSAIPTKPLRPSRAALHQLCKVPPPPLGCRSNPRLPASMMPLLRRVQPAHAVKEYDQDEHRDGHACPERRLMHSKSMHRSMMMVVGVMRRAALQLRATCSAARSAPCQPVAYSAASSSSTRHFQRCVPALITLMLR